MTRDVGIKLQIVSASYKVENAEEKGASYWVELVLSFRLFTYPVALSLVHSDTDYSRINILVFDKQHGISMVFHVTPLSEMNRHPPLLRYNNELIKDAVQPVRHSIEQLFTVFIHTGAQPLYLKNQHPTQNGKVRPRLTTE